jgi:cytochrome c peroxidase
MLLASQNRTFANAFMQTGGAIWQPQNYPIAKGTAMSQCSLTLLIASGFLAISINLAAADNDAQQLLSEASVIFKPLPKTMATPEFPVTPERVDLGSKLFFDPRISADGTVSCARCHQPALYGTDGLPKPHGAHDKLNPRNAPTVLNAALQFKAHWHGDRENVEDQAKQALVGPPCQAPITAGAAIRRCDT